MKKIILILSFLLVSCSNTVNKQDIEESNQTQEVPQTNDYKSLRNDDFEFSEKYINNGIKKVETEENYSDLYVCNDINPETTCGDSVIYVSNEGINFFEYFYYIGINMKTIHLF